jgi:hypothetical protein
MTPKKGWTKLTKTGLQDRFSKKWREREGFRIPESGAFIEGLGRGLDRVVNIQEGIGTNDFDDLEDIVVHIGDFEGAVSLPGRFTEMQQNSQSRTVNIPQIAEISHNVVASVLHEAGDLVEGGLDIGRVQIPNELDQFRASRSG